MKTLKEILPRGKPMKPSLEKLRSIENTMMFTLDEAAALCGVTAAGVRNWITKGKINRVRVGSRFYVTGEELKRAFDL